MYSFDNDELPNHFKNYFSEIASDHNFIKQGLFIFKNIIC